jgi:hypothetical protein
MPGNVRKGATGTWKAVHGTPELTVGIDYSIGGTGWSLRLHVKNPAIGSNEADAATVDHSGNAVVKTLSLDAREPHGV